MGGLRSFWHHLLNRLGVESENHENGLTLIELMVVVVILGIISAVAIPSISSAITSAKVSTTESDLATVQEALQRYYIDTGTYPVTSSWVTDLTTQTTANGKTVGPYLDTTTLKDAWGDPIGYRTLPTSGSTVTGYVIASVGSTGNLSTANNVILDTSIDQGFIYAIGGNNGASVIDTTPVEAQGAIFF